MSNVNAVPAAIGALSDDVRQLLATPETVTMIRDVMPKRPVLFTELFPVEPTMDFTATYFKQQNGEDVAQAMIMSFDSETPLNVLPGIEQIMLNLCKVGSKIPWKESDIAIYSTLAPEKRRELMLDYQSVATRLGLAIRERQETMAIEAITKGVITINDGNLNKAVDFKIPDKQKPVLYGSDLWSDPTSKPLEDIKAFTV